MSAETSLSGTTNEVILEATDLSRSFRGLQALADYHLRLRTSEILGVIGPNGAGKTTLFNVITGFLPPTSGTIQLRGPDITGKEPDRVTALGIARTYQNIRLFARMTVLDNVKTAQQLRSEGNFWQAMLSTPTFRRQERALDRAGLRPSRVRLVWPALLISTLQRFPTASSASWKSPAPWRPNRWCFSWMSRRPA